MNGIIVYKSNYGSTRQYAEWIHEETGFPVHETKERSIPFEQSDIIVIGSPERAWKPLLTKWIQTNWESLQGKKVILFTTSQTPPTSKSLQRWLREALPETITSSIEYFPLHGRMIYQDLSFPDKINMRIGQMIEKDPVIKKEMVKSMDGVDRKNIGGIVDHIRSVLEKD